LLLVSIAATLVLKQRARFIFTVTSSINHDNRLLIFLFTTRPLTSRPICKVNGSPYSITERRVPELIPVLDSQPAGDVTHKPGRKLPSLSARPAVTPATLKRAATNFAAW